MIHNRPNYDSISSFKFLQISSLHAINSVDVVNRRTIVSIPFEEGSGNSFEKIVVRYVHRWKAVSRLVLDIATYLYRMHVLLDTRWVTVKIRIELAKRLGGEIFTTILSLLTADQSKGFFAESNNCEEMHSNASLFFFLFL